MRFHRSKLVRKYLRFYRIVYGIEPPYDIILDGNFIYAALNHHTDIRDRLYSLLQETKVRLHVTRSVINELTELGPKSSSSLEFATKFCSIIEDKSSKQMDTTAQYLLDYLGFIFFLLLT
jgi:rRNA-processing protein FCF1